jgi:hypothetical protein
VIELEIVDGGKPQPPPLTEDEVIAATRQSDWRRDAKEVSEREFAAFKAVAESRRLPENSCAWGQSTQPTSRLLESPESTRAGRANLGRQSVSR